MSKSKQSRFAEFDFFTNFRVISQRLWFGPQVPKKVGSLSMETHTLRTAINWSCWGHNRHRIVSQPRPAMCLCPSMSNDGRRHSEKVEKNAIRAHRYFASSVRKQIFVDFYQGFKMLAFDRSIPLSWFALFCSTHQCDAMLKVRFKFICQTQGWNFHEILPTRISLPDWLDNFEISLRADWQRLPWGSVQTVGDNCEQTPVIGDFFLLHFHMFTARQSIEVLNELLSQTTTDSAAAAFLGDKSIMGTLCRVIRKGEGTCSASFDSWRVRVYATSMLIDFERPWFRHFQG